MPSPWSEKLPVAVSVSPEPCRAAAAVAVLAVGHLSFHQLPQRMRGVE
jgi:hypothetical protein